MAGGTGTRLYPRSRENFPKQFQKIIGDTSLLQQTFNRVMHVVDKENIFVSTNQKYTETVVTQLGVATEQVVGEPAKRNTGPAMALATQLIFQKDPQAIIACVHSDHLVLRPHVFAQALATGFQQVEQNSQKILTVGIEPTMAHTGYGYIQREKLFAETGEFQIYNVSRFVEKPDKKTAEDYVDSGQFYWNAGYFIWQGKHFLNELKRLEPKLFSGTAAIVASVGKENFEKILKEEFEKFDDVAIDTAIMERTKEMLVLPANIGWSDVGSWDTVAELTEEKKKDEFGNYVEGLHIGIDTHNAVVLSHDKEKLIATIGLDNVIIVTSEDAILISSKGRGQEVKKVVEELKKRGLDNLV